MSTPDVARAVGRLVGLQAVLGAAFVVLGAPTTAVGAVIAWVTLRWIAASGVGVRDLGGVLAWALPGLGAVAALGGAWAGVAVAGAVVGGFVSGLVLALAVRFPRLDAAGSDAETWAREHRDEYTGVARRPGGTAPSPSLDPLAFISGGDGKPVPPTLDPWEQAWGTGNAVEVEE